MGYYLPNQSWCPVCRCMALLFQSIAKEDLMAMLFHNPWSMFEGLARGRYNNYLHFKIKNIVKNLPKIMEIKNKSCAYYKKNMRLSKCTSAGIYQLYSIYQYPNSTLQISSICFSFIMQKKKTWLSLKHLWYSYLI